MDAKCLNFMIAGHKSFVRAQERPEIQKIGLLGDIVQELSSLRAAVSELKNSSAPAPAATRAGSKPSKDSVPSKNSDRNSEPTAPYLRRA